MKNIPDYLKTVKDCAEEWGISKRRVQIYCEEDRIEGAWTILVNPKGCTKTTGKGKKKRVLNNQAFRR